MSGPERCPTCGLDNPRMANDVLRPEQPPQPATWIDSGGGINQICGDPFHAEGCPDYQPEGDCTCPYDPETGVAEYTKPNCPMHGTGLADTEASDE